MVQFLKSSDGTDNGTKESTAVQKYRGTAHLCLVASHHSLDVDSSQNRRSVSAHRSTYCSRLSASSEQSGCQNSFNSSGHSPEVNNSYRHGSDTDLDEAQV